MNNLIRKIASSFMVIMFVLSTMFVYEAFADVIYDPNNIDYYLGDTPTIGCQISDVTHFEDLRDNSRILCNKAGTHLWGSNLIYEAGKHSGLFKDTSESYGSGLNTETGKTSTPIWDYFYTMLDEILGGQNTNQIDDYDKYMVTNFAPAENYTVWGYHSSKYSGAGSGITANARQAYILAHVDEDVGAYPSDIQRAWRNESSTRGAEANEFQSYINAVSSGGTVKYKPKWEDTEKKVLFDKTNNTFKVGPFKISYHDSKFSGIKNIELYTNLGEATLGSDWWIARKDDNYDDKNETYPSPDELFYIVIKNKDGLTKIENLKVNFDYTKASGTYHIHTGTTKMIRIYVRSYSKFINSFDQVEGLEERLINGGLSEYEERLVYYYTTNQRPDNGTWDGYAAQSYRICRYRYLKSDNLDCPVETQPLVCALNGKVWKETTSIEWSTDIHEGKIKITKQLVDGQGNVIPYESLTKEQREHRFAATVSVSGAENSGSETVYFSVESPGTSKTYYWIGDTLPTYTVTESDSGGYTYVGGAGSGSLSDNNTVEVVIRNRPQVKVKKILIEKVLQKPKTIEQDMFDELLDEYLDEKFYFKVTLNGTFMYDGQSFEDEKYELPLIDVNVNQRKETKEIEYYGEPPTYTIEEVNADGTPFTTNNGMKFIDITPNSSGSLDTVTGQALQAKAINGPEVKYAKLRIVKELKDAKNFSDDYIDSLKFNFTVAVNTDMSGELEGNFNPNIEFSDDEKFEVTLDKDNKIYTEDGTIQWIWESEAPYYWQEGFAPHYSITEHDNPKGTELSEAYVKIASGGENLLAIDQIVSGDDIQYRVVGKLGVGAENGCQVTNRLINVLKEVKYGKIQVSKIIEKSDDIDFASKLLNKDYKVDLRVKGKFAYYIGTTQILPYGEYEIRLLNPEYPSADNAYIKNDEADSLDSNMKDYIILKIGDEEVDGKYTASYNVDDTKYGYFMWLGDEAPVYEIAEVTRGEEVEDSIINKSDKLTGKTIEVATACENVNDLMKEASTQATDFQGAVGASNESNISNINIKNSNEPDTKEGVIRIIKILEGADQYDPAEIEKLEFPFNLSIQYANGTTETNKIYAKPEKQENNTYIWKWESGRITWKSDEEAPKYTITECIEELPEDLGIEFVSANSPNPEAIVNNKTIEGQVKEAGESEGPTDEIVDATDIEFINRIGIDTNARIRLKKVIVDNDKLKDKTYKFVLSITGEFYTEDGKEYNGTYYFDTNKNLSTSREEIEIYIGKDSLEETWESPMIYWVEDESKPNLGAPTYEVKEVEEDGIECELTYAKPALLSNSIDKVVDITAKNALNLDKGKLKIAKSFVTNSGAFGNSYTFNFLVNINEEGFEPIKVPVTVTTTDGVNYYGESEEIDVGWKPGSIPDYSIKELNSGNGIELESVSVTGSSDYTIVESGGKPTGEVKGKVIKDQTITFNYNNTLTTKKSGSLKITKAIDNVDSLKNQTYAFTVGINSASDFTYGGTNYSAGQYYLNTSKELTTDSNSTVEIHVSSSTAEYNSNEFTWNLGDSAPTFTVNEIGVPANQRTIEPSSGSLESDDNSATKVLVYNYAGTKNGSLKIYKEFVDSVENGRYNNKEFEFQVNVSGKPSIIVPVKVTSLDGKNYYGESGDIAFSWDEAQAPTYTVEEINIDAGISFVGVTCSDASATITDRKVSGRLSQNNTISFSYKNQTSDGGKLQEADINLVKVIDNYEALQNREYKFMVKISSDGNFKYAGTDLGAGTYYLNTDGSISADAGNRVSINIGSNQTRSNWVSNKIQWDSNQTAPKYEVEEDEIPGIVATISNKNGQFIGNSTQTITANNQLGGGKKQGKIQIKKTFEDTTGTLAGAGDVEFYFNIQVDGHEDRKVGVKLTNIGGNIYEGSSEVLTYEWPEAQDAPQYTIKEEETNGVICESITCNTTCNANAASRTVKGTLQEESEGIIEFTYRNKKTRSLGKSGYIKIVKKLTEPIETKGAPDDPKQLIVRFKVTLTGTFKYGNTDEKIQHNYTDEPLVIEGEDCQVILNENDHTVEWVSKEITWQSSINRPEYVVEEVGIVDPKDSNNILTDEYDVKMYNSTGVVGLGSSTVITAVNVKKDSYTGSLKIEKELPEKQINYQDNFYFDVKIGDDYHEVISIKYGEVWKSPIFSWNIGDKIPEYVVKEINLPEGCQFKEWECPTDTDYEKDDATIKIKGYLIDKQEISITAVNEYKENKGQFVIKKEVLKDKNWDGSSPNFKITAKVITDLGYDKEGNFQQKIETYNMSLSDGETWTSPEIVWYGKYAPLVIVTEDTTTSAFDSANAASGEKVYKLLGISSGLNGTRLAEDTAQITVSNAYTETITLNMFVTLAGTVWEDEKTIQNKIDVADGKMSGEKGIAGVKVYIDKITNGAREEAEIFAEDGKTPIEQPIITKFDGSWIAPAVKAPLGTGNSPSNIYYDVRFVYDGQTYTPTQFLATSSGNADAYMNSDSRESFFKDSMAVESDDERARIDNTITEVNGKVPINGNFDTVGSVDGGTEIYYSGKQEDNGLVKSKLVTTDEGRIALKEYEAEATTLNGGLKYLFDNKINPADANYTLIGVSKSKEYTYIAAYDYALNINLGLVKRETVDIEANKDLVEAKVVVNNRLVTYKFNTLENLTKNKYYEILPEDTISKQVHYQIGLYQTDYYYRAELYQSNENYPKFVKFYTDMERTLDETELEIYLKYRISVYNDSKTYKVKINSINDYFDSSFKRPIAGEVTKYIKNVNGKETNDTKHVIAEASTLEGNPVEWKVKEENVVSSDGNVYNKMTAEFGDLVLNSGEHKEIFVTFRVGKDTFNNVADSIILGEKNNIVEIDSYTALYSDDASLYRLQYPNAKTIRTGGNAGRIDDDSAPDNINLKTYNGNYNVKTDQNGFKKTLYYEDDTYRAPVMELKFADRMRNISGTAWEDNENEGIIDSDEALIGGLTTQLVEKVQIPEDGAYTEYDFLWPTSKPLSALGGKTLEYLTGFDSTIETGMQEVKDEDDNIIETVGGYKFKNIPSGNYVVRFLYGNDKAKLDDTNEITGEPIALNSDGTPKSGSLEILTANYDEDMAGKTPAVYNGQDYKSTIYQKDNSNSKLNREMHDLTEYTNYAVDSDARDSESRRLAVMANSQIITNDNAEDLIQANSRETDVNYTTLFNDYWMYADTGKINIYIDQELTDENTNSELSTFKSTKDVEMYTNERPVKLKDKNIENINIGLIERPENEIVLDKQIKQIKLKTNDNNVIFNADYDIEYQVISERELNKYYGDSNNYGNNDDIEYKISSVIDEVSDGEFLVAMVIPSSERSIKTELLQALNKKEKKLTTELSSGIQNFRFINIEDTILHGTTIEITYEMTALNVGENDYISTALKNDVTAKNSAVKNPAKSKLLERANEIEKAFRTFTSNEIMNVNSKQLKIGDYLGKSYYLGGTGEELVTTTIKQIVDYIDNDAIFASENNSTKNHSWRNTNMTELTGNGYDEDRLLSKIVSQNFDVVDKEDISYITDERNNIVLSIDNTETDTRLNNSGFQKPLIPYNGSNEDEYKSSIELTITKTVSAQEDTDNMTFDNLAEVVKFANTAGRRDMLTVPGNANPKEGEFVTALEERDSSATELITFTPPTGINSESVMQTQLLIVMIASLGIIAAGIVIIKRKVLTK